MPWHNFYGFRDDYSHVSADIATANLRHDFGDGWTFHDQARFASYGRSYRDVEPTISEIVAPRTPLDDLAVARTVRGGASHEGFLEDQADLTGEVELFGLKHTLVFSGSLGQQVSDPRTLSFSGAPGTNLTAPDENQYFSGAWKVKSLVHFTATTASISAENFVELGARWRLDGAVRVDRFAADYANATPAPVSFQHYRRRRLLPRRADLRPGRDRARLRPVGHVVRPVGGGPFAQRIHGRSGPGAQRDRRGGDQVDPNARAASVGGALPHGATQ